MGLHEDDYLKRLAPEHYRGQAYVHWSLTIDERKTGWLIPIFYYRFRELLTHAAFRFGFSCPIYCCMPDHIHLLWVGIDECCDQRIAMRYLRKHLNSALEKLSVRLQSQGFDHVLREEEKERGAFEAVAEYIALNPERKGLVPAGGYADYKFTDCLVPGYPELKPFEAEYWDRYWRVHNHLSKNGFQRKHP